MRIADFAAKPNLSFGRRIPEKGDATLNFLKDREKIAFSSSFRKLEHKMQVFVNFPTTLCRTRFSHSFEVSCVAKRIASALCLNQELAEAISLGHDLGHPPFSHAGEKALCDAMEPFGGFNHNVHTLKVVAMLENYPEHEDGLNLCYETIEGLAKHNGPVPLNSSFAFKIHQLFPYFDLELSKHPSLEAQVASLADDIAYCAHDVEDGLRSGFFSTKDMAHLALVKGIITNPNCDQEIAEFIRTAMISDLVSETQRNISRHNFKNVQDIREHQESVAQLSLEMDMHKNELKSFLMSKAYKHFNLSGVRCKVRDIMQGLFTRFMESPECLPQSWYHKAQNLDQQSRAIMVGDYIAGLTDRLAIYEFKRLFGLTISI